MFVSVTLPNIIAGTVGGGTNLPSQSAGLNILGLKGAGKARAYAEVCAATCLAGELWSDGIGHRIGTCTGAGRTERG